MEKGQRIGYYQKKDKRERATGLERERQRQKQRQTDRQTENKGIKLQSGDSRQVLGTRHPQPPFETPGNKISEIGQPGQNNTNVAAAIATT